MTPGPNRPHVVEGQQGETDGASEDLADLLTDPHCRYLLQYLREHDEPASVSALTRHVAAEVTDTPPAEVDDDVQRRVETWFHHGQLPVLDDYGVVDFDPESDTVRLTADPAT